MLYIQNIKPEITFLNRLLNMFSRKDNDEIARYHNIPDKTAQNDMAKLLKIGLIHRDKQDYDVKTPVEEIEYFKDSKETEDSHP